MQLPFISGSPTNQSNKKSDPRLYLVVVVNSSQVQAALWHAVAEAVEVLAVSQPLTFASREDVVVKVDEALQELGKQSEGVDDVIFGVPNMWVKAGEVDAPHQELLAEISKKLSLKPMGFVDLREGLTAHLTQHEPLFSAVLVEYLAEQLQVSLMIRGQILTQEVIGRSGDAAADLQEALARFQEPLGENKLPPQLLLYSLDPVAHDLSAQQQDLLKVDWQASQPFLHQPDVVVLDEHILVQSLVAHAGRGMGLKSDFPDPAEHSTNFADENLQTGMSDSPPNDTPVGKSFGIQMPLSRQVDDSDDNLKAVDDELVAAFQDTPPQHEHSEAVSSSPKSSRISFDLNQLTPFLKGFTHPLISVEKWAGSHLPVAIGGFVVGLAMLWLMSWWYFANQVVAVITITPKTVTVSKEADITISTTANQANPETMTLPAEEETATVNGSVTTQATGTKLVGEKATGEITIINKTTSVKSFPAGTRVSTGKLSFLLNDEVQIASASVSSSSDGETKTYGKSQVKVSAAAIGAESNLAKGTELTVAEFSRDTYSAEVSSDLSGGSSREVRVVATADIRQARQNLLSDLTRQAVEKFKNDSQGGRYFVPVGTPVLTDEDLSAKEGEEATSLTLTANAKAKAVVYSQDDLKPLASAVLEDQIPQGYQLTDQPPQILSAPEAASGSAKVTISANISAEAEPQFNFDQLVQDLMGIPVAEAETKLASRSEVATSEIRFIPSMARFFKKRLPGKAEQIKLQVGGLAE